MPRRGLLVGLALLLRRLARRLALERRRRRDRMLLLGFDDRFLKDINVTRAELGPGDTRWRELR